MIVADDATSSSDKSPPPESEVSEDKNQYGTSLRHHSKKGRTPDLIYRPLDETDEAALRKRSASTPTKRVWSDGHWRNKRSPPKGENELRKGVKSNSKADSAEEKPQRHQSNRRVSSSNQTPTKDYNKSEIDVHSNTDPSHYKRTGLSRRRKSKDAKVDVNEPENPLNCTQTHDDKSSQPSQRKVSTRSVRRELSMTDSAMDRKRSRKEDHDKKDRLGRSGTEKYSLSESRASQRLKGGNILSQVLDESRRLFTSQTAEPDGPPRIPSIEQWLNDTSDPFMDDGPPIEEIPPLRPLRHKRKITPQSTSSQDHRQGCETPLERNDTVHESHRSTTHETTSDPAENKDRSGTNDFGTLSQAAGDSKISHSRKDESIEAAKLDTSPSLGRRGARRRASSPIKGRKKSCGVNSTHSNSSDNVPSHSEEQSQEGVHRRPSHLKPDRNVNRRFPSLGEHRLSTIASVTTLNTGMAEAMERSRSSTFDHPDPRSTAQETVGTDEARDQFDPNALHRQSSRIAKHSDLMSVLSLPDAGGRSIRSARSIRTMRSRLGTASIPELMQELASDEEKYMRELQALVDGVIPVLLTCVLSKSDSKVAAGLFDASGSAQGDSAFTKPIVDMGIALERLRTLHKRMPQGDHRGFLTWAHGAHRVYSEYLKSWRMGFQDVVVNLAPATDNASTTSHRSDVKPGQPGSDILKNAEGDVTNGDGDRVDVAFLLKRPLVRIKYLAKVLKGIDSVLHSKEAEILAAKYQDLVEQARQRASEERSRLEDEAAANIDASRVRDPRTLAPVAGVAIDRTKRVRARDHFNLTIHHSDGQRVDCRAELVLRDSSSSESALGDILICEVDETSRWLLLPPVRSDHISARNGDLQGEIVVMIRGVSASGHEWQELIALNSEDESVGFEWVQMLGLNPVPPQLSRSQSFVARRHVAKTGPDSPLKGEARQKSVSKSPTKSRTPSPRDIEVPIGEPANEVSRSWETLDTPISIQTRPRETQSPYESKHDVMLEQSPATPTRASATYIDQVSDLRSLPSQNRPTQNNHKELPLPPRSFKEALGLSGSSNHMGLRRTRAKRISKHGDSSPGSKTAFQEKQIPTSPAENDKQTARSSTHKLERASELEGGLFEDEVRANRPEPSESVSETRPPILRAPSSLPAQELPYVPKARKGGSPATPTKETEIEPSWSTAPSPHLPTSSSRKLAKKRPGSSDSKETTLSPSALKIDKPLPGSGRLDASKTPVLEKGLVKQRRSSSPLKHEYAPSTASDSSSDSEASTVAHNKASSVSDSSDEEDLEDGDVPTPLLSVGALKSLPKPPNPKVTHTQTEGSIKPSDSASQAPYKTVPAQPTKACKTIASIFSWSDEGAWKSLHPDECSIVITPGLIEAFEMSAAHSHFKPPTSAEPVVDLEKFSDLASELTSQNDDVRGERPLVALELTPLVPLRRGTAIDISIRSPPTPNSQITTGTNIMFRSRSPEECEALYALINYSRIHNPTYIALQNARPSFGGGSAFQGPGSRRPGSATSHSRSSWFGGWGRSSSYRASTKRTNSVAQTESSIASMSSAFSALRRFSNRGGGGIFNIAKSTIGSRTGSRPGSVYTSSDNSSGSGTSSPMPPGIIASGREAPIGLSNAKIRLYVRETASKWRDMGSARLTIMQPDRNLTGPDGRPLSSFGPPPPFISREKRVVINGKTKGEILLDEQLGESCFERVARTGIAVSVWEDVIGPNGEVGVVKAVGGVAGGRATVYMIQVSD